MSSGMSDIATEGGSMDEEVVVWLEGTSDAVVLPPTVCARGRVDDEAEEDDADVVDGRCMSTVGLLFVVSSCLLSSCCVFLVCSSSSVAILLTRQQQRQRGRNGGRE
jgi:hypothetical protein